MEFILGERSLSVLAPAHPNIQRVVRRAIRMTKVDFKVAETLRTLEQQKDNVAKGVSWTMDSKHLRQPDGFSHAVDLWAIVNGQVSWAWPLYYRIAEAMQEASYDEGVPLVWGGCWDRKLAVLGHDLEAEMAEYVARRKKLGKKANCDGPHYELA